MDMYIINSSLLPIRYTIYFSLTRQNSPNDRNLWLAVNSTLLHSKASTSIPGSFPPLLPLIHPEFSWTLTHLPSSPYTLFYIYTAPRAYFNVQLMTISAVIKCNLQL